MVLGTERSISEVNAPRIWLPSQSLIIILWSIWKRSLQHLSPGWLLRFHYYVYDCCEDWSDLSWCVPMICWEASGRFFHKVPSMCACTLLHLTFCDCIRWPWNFQGLSLNTTRDPPTPQVNDLICDINTGSGYIDRITYLWFKKLVFFLA